MRLNEGKVQWVERVKVMEFLLRKRLLQAHAEVLLQRLRGSCRNGIGEGLLRRKRTESGTYFSSFAAEPHRKEMEVKKINLTIKFQFSKLVMEILRFAI